MENIFGEKSVQIREKKNVFRIAPNVEIKSLDDLSTHYTPGIAEVSKEIAEDRARVFDLTIKRNSVAVVTDGSAVLGLGNIGPEAALPVMEGKSLLFSEFAKIDAFPVCLNTQDPGEIIKTVRNIAPAFGGINLEDISAPRCFEIEEKLQDLGIPVMHDDQHGTATVVLAGLINALKVVNKEFDKVKIVISGAGAAGIAIAKMINHYTSGKVDIVMVDSKGIISRDRKDLNKYKQEVTKFSKNDVGGSLADALLGADIFVGVSAPNVLTKEMVLTMNKNAIIFAMANPVPEIDPTLALEAGAKVVATGRSDFPNQMNNVLAFPGIFRGALDAKALKITRGMQIAAAEALANLILSPTAQKIIPSALEKNVVSIVAAAVREAAIKENVIRKLVK